MKIFALPMEFFLHFSFVSYLQFVRIVPKWKWMKEEEEKDHMKRLSNE